MDAQGLADDQIELIAVEVPMARGVRV